MVVYITSDHHFGHKNIIEYCKRPFKTIQEHDEILMQRWNVTIGQNDIVYYLGDFALTNFDSAKKILSKLNGYKILILGNHDKSIERMTEMGFNEAYGDRKKDCLFFIDHYGDKFINRKIKNCFILKHRPMTGFECINVSVDKWDFYPILLSNLIPPDKHTIVLHGHVHEKGLIRNKNGNIVI